MGGVSGTGRLTVGGAGGATTTGGVVTTGGGVTGGVLAGGLLAGAFVVNDPPRAREGMLAVVLVVGGVVLPDVPLGGVLGGTPAGEVDGLVTGVVEEVIGGLVGELAGGVVGGGLGGVAGGMVLDELVGDVGGSGLVGLFVVSPPSTETEFLDIALTFTGATSVARRLRLNSDNANLALRR
jgi:hypothetical protein